MNWEIGLGILAAGVSVVSALIWILRGWPSKGFKPEHIEVITEPIPPDSLSSAEANLIPTVQATLREAGREQLLTEGEMQVTVEKSFPTDDVVIVMFSLASAAALETYQKIVLPALKKRYQVKQKRRERSSYRNS